MLWCPLNVLVVVLSFTAWLTTMLPHTAQLYLDYGPNYDRTTYSATAQQPAERIGA
jgi:hypothetical protein